MIKLANLSSLTFFTLASLSLCTSALADTEVITEPEAVASVTSQTDLPSSDANPSRDENLEQLGYQSTDISTEQPLPPVPEEQDWTDDRREDIQDQLHEWAHKMDGWFGQPNPNEPAKASLRVVLDTRWVDDPETGADVTVEPRIRGRLRLPVLERRLSLIIGDEDLDDDTFLTQGTTGDNYQTTNNNTNRLIDAKRTREENASIALRWSRFNDEVEEQLGVNTDVDLGIRSLDDPYLQVSIDKDWYEGKKLAVTSDSFYRYGLDSEHYAKGDLNLQYGADTNRFINNHTSVRYRNEADDEQKDWSNDLRQVHHLGHEKQLSYGLSASGYFESDKSGLNSYGPAISYRQPVWREWFYVQTELNYYNDKIENKDHYPSALLRMEAFF
ncbi:hypothetical protein [Psychrobacter sp.]|uniref:hypothetical protein n=1 Tax=Psychrobacter sp. TaxID=56811 RepID=UPI003F95AE78